MSMPTKELKMLRKALGRGGYKKVSDKIDCTPEWVGQVLRSATLAAKHKYITQMALTVIAEEKQSTDALSTQIKEVLK